MVQNMLFDDMTDGAEAKAAAARRHSKPGPPEPDLRAVDKSLILAQLRKGPTTNHALNEIVMSYRQRISDLRKEGYRIDNRRLGGRVTLYELK